MNNIQSEKDGNRQADLKVTRDEDTEKVELDKVDKVSVEHDWTGNKENHYLVLENDGRQKALELTASQAQNLNRKLRSLKNLGGSR